MAGFPVISNFEGDFLLQLVLVDDQDTMDEAAQKCAYHSLGRRVRAPKGDYVLRVRRHSDGEMFARDLKIGAAQLKPTETLDVVFGE